MAQLNFDFANRNICIVNRLYSAYVSLTFAPKNESNSRMVSVARFGAFEVRLVELADHPNTEGPDFWIELYRHDAKSSLDSYRCQDLEEGEPIANRLISDAKELHESSDESFRT
jgi:hypothetical protein